MNLAELKKKGGVIADALVAKKVEWTHVDEKGKEFTDKFTVHVRRHAFGVMETMFASGDTEHYKNARYVSASVMLGEDGTEELPFEDAVNLHPGLGMELLKAVNEVNSPKGKKSPPRKKSGTSSSSTA
ncbi:phage tail assembly chaperone family protein, TAC [Pseudomonas sp. RP23018S]|uniref:phage tail assembly chaperone family protein, TAC n=1 Tax=Pseudomonas sp. RP23018S TaxID=3096037 RepID=UPI002ACA2FD0|nr:phage tail assembly chaperone family protein, TAC [Pseudomonas sp. RP23018S]MDZ5601738.1 phage tail assembly chaperone family protein, TAC [Pseudomonas sp. RP23018S]